MGRTRILYCAGLNSGGNGADRLRELEALGYELISFDLKRRFDEAHRHEKSLAARFNTGPVVRRINRELQTLASARRFDAIWIDKGVWIYPSTLRFLKSRATTGIAIHFTPDSQLLLNRSRHFLRGIADYDLCVTSKPVEVDLYRKNGAHDVLLASQGFGSRCRPPDSANIVSDVVFVGRCEPHYTGRLRALSDANLDVRVYGRPWVEYAQRHPWAQKVVRGGSLWGDEYVSALASSSIALGLLTKRFPESATTRTFEIPACGGFLLAERTDEHLSLFEEGTEAEFFGSDEEMVSKARFYSANGSARARIAAAGLQRCIKSNYDSLSQLRRIMTHASVEFGINAPLNPSRRRKTRNDFVPELHAHGDADG